MNYHNLLKYAFKYTNPEVDDAVKAGFLYFPGFPELDKTYENDELFANILTRLPNKSRPDYLEILNSYNLEINSSNLEILKATKGRLITDNYEFVPAFDNYKIEFDVAGMSHSSDIKECFDKKLINVNDKIELEMEPTNKYDKNVIKVLLNKNGRKYQLGYVPRYYAKKLTNLLNNNVKYSAMIKNANFESVFNDEDITAYVKLIFNK